MSYSPSGKWRMNEKLWSEIRTAVLERDHHTCRIRSERCTTVATEVDHIVRPDEGGPRFDPSNLRAACRACNRSRGGTAGAQIRNRRRGQSEVPASREW